MFLSRLSHKEYWFIINSKLAQERQCQECFKAVWTSYFFFPNRLGPLLKGLLDWGLGPVGQSLAKCPDCWQLKQFPVKGLLWCISGNCWVGAMNGIWGWVVIIGAGAHIGEGAQTEGIDSSRPFQNLVSLFLITLGHSLSSTILLSQLLQCQGVGSVPNVF